MTLKFGVISCGKAGLKHCEILSNLEGAELKAVCDVKEEKVRELAAKYNIKYFTNYKELLKDDLDVVNVCSPTGLHAEMTIEAAKAGKHIICEKPMALTLEDCEAMVNACKENKVKFFVVKQNRHNPILLKLKETIDNKKFGKVFLNSANIYWNRTQEYYDEEAWRGTTALDGGALMNQSAHFIDLFYWLGGDIKRVYAKMGTFSRNIETEDTGVVLLEFADGKIGRIDYTTGVYNKTYEGSLTVFGTKGTVKIGGQYLDEIEHWNVEGLPAPKYDKVFDPAKEFREKFMRSVIDLLNGNYSIATTGEDAKYAVEVILAAKKSAETGMPVELPLK